MSTAALCQFTPDRSVSPLTGSPADLINTLILRQRSVSDPTAYPPYQDRYPHYSNEQLLTATEIAIAAQAGKVKLVLSHGTTIACTKCARLNAPSYYLKRSHGRYAVLCFDNGRGCWERSATSLCRYVDQSETQCMDLAEWGECAGPPVRPSLHPGYEPHPGARDRAQGDAVARIANSVVDGYTHTGKIAQGCPSGEAERGLDAC